MVLFLQVHRSKPVIFQLEEIRAKSLIGIKALDRKHIKLERIFLSSNCKLMGEEKEEGRE